MKRSNSSSVGFTQYIALACIGLCCGWLIGLSASPVLHLVLGAALGLTVSAVGIMMGMKVAVEPEHSTEEPSSGNRLSFITSSHAIMNPWPLAVIAMTIVTGSCGGVFVRTNQLLGVDPVLLQKRWNTLNISNDDCKRIILSEFESTTAESSKAKKDEKPPTTIKPTSGVLFSVSVTQCEMLKGKHGEELRDVLQTIGDKKIEKAAAECKTNGELDGMVKLICVLAK